MGVTISHTTLAPVSLASTIIGFISFTFTLATFLNVFWSSLGTIYAAPKEINDYLSNLKQGLLEERRYLRKVRRRMRPDRRSRSRDFPGGKGIRASSGGGRVSSRSRSRARKNKHQPTHFDRDIQSFRSSGEETNLTAMRSAIRDMIRQFRHLEYPFLRPEFQNQNSAQWSTTNPYSTSHPTSEKNHDDEEDLHDIEGHLSRSNRFGSEYRTCGLRERYVWLRRKAEVVSLSEGLSRVEVRRTAHEVGQVLLAIGDIGRDLEDVREGMMDLEGRLSRVVGVRRVD